MRGQGALRAGALARAHGLQHPTDARVLDGAHDLQLRTVPGCGQVDLPMHVGFAAGQRNGTDPRAHHVVVRKRCATVLAARHFGHQAVFRHGQVQVDAIAGTA